MFEKTWTTPDRVYSRFDNAWNWRTEIHIQRFLAVTQNKYENMSHFQFHQIKLSKMRSLEVALFGLEDRILVEGRTAVAVKKLALPVDVVVGVPVLRDVVVRVRPDELLPPIPFVAIYEQIFKENNFFFTLCIFIYCLHFIQYKSPRLKPTTSWLWVLCLNHCSTFFKEMYIKHFCFVH